MSQQTSVFPSGKILSEKRLQDLSDWQAQAYKKHPLKIDKSSRQGIRRIKLKIKKSKLASEKLMEIKLRHQNRKKKRKDNTINPISL